MPRTGVGSPPSDPTQALRRSGVLFVRDESGIRLDLQLADVGFDESAIQRTVEIRAGARPNMHRRSQRILRNQVETKQEYSSDFVTLSYAILHIAYYDLQQNPTNRIRSYKDFK